MFEIGLGHYLTLGAIIFTIGIVLFISIMSIYIYPIREWLLISLIVFEPSLK